MESKNKIKAKAAGMNFVDVGSGTFAIGYSSVHDYGMGSFLGGISDWDSGPESVSGVRVVPWGMSNSLPKVIREVLEKNNLGPGVLRRKIGLIYGQGAQLFRWTVQNGERIQQWTDDADVSAWLDSWDFKKYLRDALVEYTHMEGVFTKYVAGRYVRVGKPWITRLECIPSKDVRIVWPDSDRQRLEDVSSFLVGDFDRYKNFELFPKFDKWNPTKKEASVGYSSMRSFGRNMYSVSSFFGSIPWMMNANDLSDIVSVLNENIIGAAYIVHEPAGYWESKRQLLIEMHPDWESTRIEKEIVSIQDSITQKIADVMSGKKNVGKFFTCVDFTDEMGHPQVWKVEPIEMNIDKFIDAQVKISRIADSATTSGMGLFPSLSGIIIDGKSDSGSQMLYALKIFYGSDTQIAEEIALEAINDAIRINFPGKKGLQLGLYRQMIQKEDNVSAGDRAVNQV